MGQFYFLSFSCAAGFLVPECMRLQLWASGTAHRHLGCYVLMILPFSPTGRLKSGYPAAKGPFVIVQYLFWGAPPVCQVLGVGSLTEAFHVFSY